MSDNKMRRCFVYSAAVFVLLSFAGCSSIQGAYHASIMRGQILDVSGSEVYLCIGRKDGAAVGQEFEVVRHVPSRQTTAKGSHVSSFIRELTGKVRITEIVDEHYAKAVIISGRAGKYDVVELDRGIK